MLYYLLVFTVRLVDVFQCWLLSNGNAGSVIWKVDWVELFSHSSIFSEHGFGKTGRNGMMVRNFNIYSAIFLPTLADICERSSQILPRVYLFYCLWAQQAISPKNLGLRRLYNWNFFKSKFLYEILLIHRFCNSEKCGKI